MKAKKTETAVDVQELTAKKWSGLQEEWQGETCKVYR